MCDLALFEAPKRKNSETGKVIEFNPRTAVPRIADIEGPAVVAEPLR
jgi:hypothetical protein